MPNVIDRLKLIAEVRKRPALWDTQSKEHRSCLSVSEVWKELAASMASDVSTCKREWSSLCKVYWGTSKRIESLIKEDKLKNTYGPNKDYRSKWTYFEAMQFMKDITKSRPIKLGSSSVTENDDDNDSDQFSAFNNMDLVKVEPEDDVKPDIYLPDDGNIKKEPEIDLEPEVYLPDDDDTDSQMHSEKSHNIDNIKKEPEVGFDPEHNIDNIGIKKELKADLDPDDEVDDTGSQMNSEEFLSEDEEIQPALYKKSPQSPVDVINNISGQNSLQNQKLAEDKSSSRGGNCTKRSYDQVNNLEDHEKEEHNLAKSARLDIRSSNDMVNVGDSDYNFLVSILPQMKKMNELHNLKFRADMTDLMLDFLSQSYN